MAFRAEITRRFCSRAASRRQRECLVLNEARRDEPKLTVIEAIVEDLKIDAVENFDRDVEPEAADLKRPSSCLGPTRMRRRARCGPSTLSMRHLTPSVAYTSMAHQGRLRLPYVRMYDYTNVQYRSVETHVSWLEGGERARRGCQS